MGLYHIVPLSIMLILPELGRCLPLSTLGLERLRLGTNRLEYLLLLL